MLYISAHKGVRTRTPEDRSRAVVGANDTQAHSVRRAGIASLRCADGDRGVGLSPAGRVRGDSQFLEWHLLLLSCRVVSDRSPEPSSVKDTRKSTS